MARRHVVVSGHYYASLAGLQILEAGGNAIDAGVATGPRDRRAGKRVRRLRRRRAGDDPSGRTRRDPCDQRRRRLAEGRRHRVSSTANYGGRIPDGLLHTVVPAAPSIWIAALARFGTMSFGEVAAAAIRFAREGFPTYPFLAEQLAARQDDFAHWPTTAAIFLPNGRPPQVGEIFVQSDLARTLQYMADQERAHAHGDRLAGPEGGARCVLSRRHRRRDPAPSAGKRRLADRATISPTSTVRSNRHVASASASSMSTAAAPGRRGRWCWRR